MIKLSVLVPVYNEERLIGDLLGRVAAVDVDKEIILVDDCSTDGSWEIVSSLDLLQVIERGTIGK